MYPLALLPVVGDDLSKMDSREALRYQNTFMKNALIRGLNTVYEQARKIQDSTHPAFTQFIEYAQVVCDIARLHLEGDEIFFAKRGANKISIDDILGNPWTKNPQNKKLHESLKEWNGKLQGWKSKGTSYRGSDLRSLLEALEGPLMKGLFELVYCIKADVLSKEFNNNQMQAMIYENIVWLASNSDVSILLPYCMSHHDPATSKYWPAITKDGVAAMPQLVQEHASKWAFAPFDPIKRTKKA